MQYTDSQNKTTLNAGESNRVGVSSGWEGGLISKGELFSILRRNCSRYNSHTIHAFFTPERMKRCGINCDTFKYRKVFNADETSAIISELETLNLL